MKIYTKTGDKGDTALVGGERVPKDDLRIEAYGTIDELNATIGQALSHLSLSETALSADLIKIQHHLFDLGSELASLSDRKSRAKTNIPQASAKKVGWLEKQIDQYTKELPPITYFILPGGSVAASSLHISRTVCRRAERQIINLSGERPINPELIKYINRLSDFLFTVARYANLKAGVGDVRWQADSSH